MASSGHMKWTGSGKSVGLLVDLSQLSKFQTDFIKIKGLFEQYRAAGLQLAFIAATSGVKGRVKYWVYPRDCRPRGAFTVDCDGPEHLVEVIRANVSNMDYYQLSQSEPRTAAQLMRSSHNGAFPNMTIDSNIIPMKGRTGPEGVFVPNGYTLTIVVGTPYSGSYNDIHVMFIQQDKSFGYGGDVSVSDLNSQVLVEGPAYTSDAPPPIGTIVYPQLAIVRKYSLAAKSTVNVKAVRFDAGEAVCTVSLPDGKGNIDVMATDLLHALPCQRNYQRLPTFSQESLSTETKGVLLTAAAWSGGNRNNIYTRFTAVPADRCLVDITFEVRAPDGSIAYTCLALDDLRDALQNTEADRNYIILGRLHTVQGPNGTLITATPPSGRPAFTNAELNNTTPYDVSGAKHNKGIAKEIMKRDGNANFLMRTFSLIEQHAHDMQLSGDIAPRGGLHGEAEMMLLDESAESTTESLLRCHSYIMTPKVVIPIGVEHLPGPTVLTNCRAPKLMAGQLLYPWKQSKDEWGNLMFDNYGEPIVGEYTVIDCGIQCVSLDDALKSAARRQISPDQVVQMFIDEQAFLTALPLYQLAAYLTIRCGSLDNVSDEALMMLAQFQLKRGSEIGAAFQDPNTRVRCYPSPAKIREGLDQALVRSELDTGIEFGVTVVVVDGPNLANSTGTVSRELTEVQTVSVLASEQKLQIMVMTDQQWADFVEQFPSLAMAQQRVRDYQNKLKMSPKDFALLACNIARNNPEYMTWARQAVFSTLTTLKIGNPEQFTRMFETTEDMHRYMLPLWCLLRCDGVDLAAAHEDFVAKTHAHITTKAPEIEEATAQLKALVTTHKKASDRLENPDNAGPALTTTLLACSLCLRGGDSTGKRWNNHRHATHCIEVRCDTKHTQKYEFEQCTFVSPKTGERCDITTCASFRDARGRCPRHSQYMDAKYTDKRWLSSIATKPQKRGKQAGGTVVKRPVDTLMLCNFRGADEITPCLPAVACASCIVGNGGLIWLEQLIGNPAKLELFLRLVAGGQVDVAKVAGLVEILGTADGASLAQFRGVGDQIQVTTAVNDSNMVVIQYPGGLLPTPIRCFVDTRGGEPLCSLTAPRVLAVVASMEHLLRMYQMDTYQQHFLVGEDCGAVVPVPTNSTASESDLSDAVERSARVSLVRYFAGFSPVQRDRDALVFDDVRELPVFQRHAALLRESEPVVFPQVPVRSPVTDVPLSVYDAHEAGGGDNPVKALRELQSRIVTQKAELKELLRKRYRTFAVLQRAENIMVESLQRTAPEIAGLYAEKRANVTEPEHTGLVSALPVGISVPAAPVTQGCTGQHCIICLGDDEGVYVQCENEHAADIVYCQVCADMVRQEGVCPICRGDVTP